MNFEEIAKNYNIAETEFTVVFSGAEALALISLVQLGYASYAPGKFEKIFGVVMPIADLLIEEITRVDRESGDLVKSGWGLRWHSKK